MEPKALIIFDLDGTLFESEHTFLPAVRTALEEMNVSVPPDREILKLLAYSPPEFVPMLLPEGNPNQRARLSERIREIELVLIPKRGRPYPGTMAVLHDLAARGAGFAVCSNASKNYIDAVLKACSLRHLFPQIRGVEEERKKEALAAELAAGSSPSRAALVGDSKSDQRSAEAAGIPFIAAMYGYGIVGIDGYTRRIEGIGALPEALDDLGIFG